jgi:hypothetical protein
VYLKITGHYARSTKEEKEEDLQAFSFSIPLPPIQHKSWFAFADNVPCLRGSQVESFTTEASMLRKGCLPTSWRIAAGSVKPETYQASQDACVAASAESDSQMRGRFDHMILPPWLPLGEEWIQLWQDGQTSDLIVNMENIQKALRLFLRGRPQSWSRWLVIPQTPYGWDIDLISEALYKEIERDNASNLKPIERITTSLSGLEGAPPPALAIRLFSSRAMQNMYYFLPLGDVASTLLLLLFVFLLGTTFWIGLASRRSQAFRTPLVILLTGTGSLFLFIILNIMLISNEAIYCNIGIAWALKSWSALNIPASSSRQEILDEIRRRNSSLVGVADDSINIQRRPDGWFTMSGMKEIEWLANNRQIIRKAMKDRKTGLVDLLSVSELDTVRQRLAQFDTGESS